MGEGLMDRFADPMLFQQMTFGEKLSGALITTLLGMGITFLVLLLLWALIAVMARLAGGQEASGVETTTAGGSGPDRVSQKAREQELTAAICAAVLAAEENGRQDPTNFTIRYIRREERKRGKRR